MVRILDPPGRYLSWGQWRRSRRAPPLAPFCALCWGRKSILEPSILGLVPVWCEACGGRGCV